MRKFSFIALLLLFLLLPITAFGQGFSLQNFSQFADGHVLAGASNYTTGDGLVLCNSWFGTGRCDNSNTFVTIQNSANSLSVTSTSACADGAPPSHSGKFLDYSTTAASGSNNQLVFLGFPPTTSTSPTIYGGSFWFCSTIPTSASFGTSFDGLQVISGNIVSRLSNYNSNGTSQNWRIEGVSNAAVPYTPNTTVLVTWQFTNNSTCGDTNNFTDCIVLRLYDRNYNLLGTDFATAPAGLTPSYMTLGNGNAITFTGAGLGKHVQYSDVRIYASGYNPIQLPFMATALPSDGVLTFGRQFDWRYAGISGGIPSGSWPQCVTASCVTAANAGTSATAAQITAALASASSNNFVGIAEGNYSITSGSIVFPTTGHVALRGAGHGAKMAFSGTAGAACGRSGNAFICAVDAANANITNPSSPTAWNSGLTQYSTVTGLTSAAGIVTTASANPTLLVYTQCDTGLSGGTTCPTGLNSDNGQAFVSDQQYNTGNSTGCCGNGPGNTVSNRGLTEIHVASGVVGNNVTLTTPIGSPLWSSARVPQVFGVQSVSMVGLENVQVLAPTASASVGISFQNVYNWWIKYSAVTDPNGKLTWGINCLGCAYGEVTSNLVDDIGNGTGNPYGIRCMMCSFNLFDNNIVLRSGTPFSFDGASSFNVLFGNYIPNASFNPTSNILQAAFNSHAFSQMDFYEMNVATQQNQDGIHGSAFGVVNHRNGYTGWWSQPTNPINAFTQARNDASFARYMTDVFGLYGTSLYHGTYTVSASCTGTNAAIWLLGTACPYAGTPGVPTDTLSSATLLRWGNYDTKNAAVRFQPSEVPSGAAAFPNFVPTVGNAGEPSDPPSWYYSARPSWWSASLAWPAIHPETTGGTLLACNGTGINTAGQYTGMPTTSASHCAGQGAVTLWGGHADPIPAMVCTQDVMGIPPDGVPVSAYTFDPSVCFAGSAPSVPTNGPQGNITLQGNFSHH